MTERVLVSVVLPTFNREAYLRQAVQSVLAQTHEDWELIVLDDGSTDGTRAYLDGIQDPRVRVILNEHTGNPGRARNLALDGTQGHYVAFLDSDDWWEADKLASQVDALNRRPDCRWCYTGLRGVAEDGREVELFDSRGFVPYDGWILERVAAGDALVATSTVMAERALVEQEGGFDEGLAVAEDWELWMRLAGRSPIAVVPRVLATFRLHAESYTAPYRDSFPEFNAAFCRILARTASPHIRRLLQRRRSTWLVRLAERRRRARRYVAALASLAAALPHALSSPRWWAAAVKTVMQPLLPHFRHR